MKKGNLIAAAAFAALAIYIIWESASFPAGKGRVPGPAVFPVIIAVIMLMSSLSLVITALRMLPEENKKLNLFADERMRVYLCMALLVVYTALIPVVGFFTTSSLFLFGLIKWFGKYSFARCALTALFIAGIVYFTFSHVLNVPFRFGFLM